MSDFSDSDNELDNHGDKFEYDYPDDSDVEETDIYDEKDFFNDTHEQYKKSYAFPVVKCPDDSILEKYE